MMAMPRPPSTRGRLSFFAYTRRPGLDTRLSPAIERSRVGPNLSETTRFLPTSASSTFHPAMYPCCWRISAMCTLMVEQGMPTVSWYAALAFRRRVSMSAIGSVIVMAWWPSSPWFPAGPSARSVGAGGAQVGRCPCAGRARARLQVLLLPAGLGDAWQLAAVGLRSVADPAEPEPAVHRPGPPAARATRVSAHLEFGRAVRFDDQRLLRHSSALLERESEPSQQRAALIVGASGGHEGHVHATLPVHLVRVDLMEHQLLVQAERVVPPAVELPVAQPPEVTDPRQRQRQQPVAELPHAVAAEGHMRADRHAFPELELSDRLLRPGHRRLLAGDHGQVLDRALDQLGIPGRLADAHVDHDLGQAGDLHDVGVAELLAERRGDLALVALLQPRRDALVGCSGSLGPAVGRGLRLLCLRCWHQMSFPPGREIRTLALVSSSKRNPTRAGFFVSGSISWTLLIWIGASW